MLFILCATLLQHCKDVVIYFDFSHFIIAVYCVKKQSEGDKENETVFSIYYTMFIFSSFTIGCERASLNRIGKDVYYVQIKGEGDTEKVEGRNLRNYTLPAYDEDGVKKQITFRSTKKENDHKLNEGAFLRLYVDQDDNNKNEISSIEVKSYEEIQKADLPKKIKEKFNIK
ncbi:hypothetical protein Bmyc01_50130 [Bacillus mycoides]|nr:hypothetical protein Bmyc01_50130 [Bacillus mycoides]